MQAIDNSGILKYNANFAYPGFTPAMSYAYDAVAKTVTVDTEALVLPAVDGVAGTFNANVQVHDAYGGTAYGHIGPNVAVGSGIPIDVSGLSPNKGLNVSATIVANIGWSATGSAFDISAAGNLQDWNIADQPAQADDSLVQ